MSSRSRRVIAPLGGALVAVVLSACGGTDYVGSGSWEVKPSPQAPQIPKPQQPGSPGGEQSDPSQPQDDGVRATGLDQPHALTALPDGTALVGERTSGVVTKVFPAKGMPQQALFTVPGIDGSTGGGLVAMAASPYYAENSLVYAYVTTATEGQVVSLNQYGVPKPLVTGLPAASAAMTIGPDGMLLVATGGSGALGGKILSIDPWGGPGPSATNGLVVATGVGNPVGMCTDGTNVYVVDGGSGAPGALTGNAVFKIDGKQSGGGLGSAMNPFVSYAAGKDAGATGCAASAVALITAGTDSQSLATTVLDKNAQPAGDPTLSLTGKYGRLRALALDPVQGGLWVGTYNRDGIGTPAADDDRVLYIPPPAGGGGAGDIS
ncbi:PQQ-dependent sugar dehydrogenase [Cumulibacter manganitolerans]|uniref:PQQ-dependent sugar dehydrogenase n=1 Tax=Cumulibacter manganitolerans TaxID=1884992 RepID=UPI0012975E11|nr:PQQ-dependent sugar dehydrogenase [Cumulibacter manganitolerans]